MPVQIRRNELPATLREPVARGILAAIGDREGMWRIDMASAPESNAWDIEVQGPNEFYWARRFSGLDRDSEVITEAIRAAVLDWAA